MLLCTTYLSSFSDTLAICMARYTPGDNSSILGFYIACKVASQMRASFRVIEAEGRHLEAESNAICRQKVNQVETECVWLGVESAGV